MAQNAFDKRSAAPSKVLFLRNLPPGCSDDDVKTIGNPFGNVINTLIISSKSQGFLEMETLDQAVTIVNYYTQPGSSGAATLKNRPVYIGYSNHQHLTASTDPTKGGNWQHFAQARGLPNHSGTILHVKILNAIYPIMLDVLHSVFSRYGPVLKIVTFTKNDTFQVLAQYENAQACRTAAAELEGKNLYANSCTFQVMLSKLDKLDVKYNNDRSRDYTNPLLPQGPFPVGGPANAPSYTPTHAAEHAAGYPPYYNQAAGAAPNYPYGAPYASQYPAPRVPAVLLISKLDKDKVTPDMLFTLVGVYADVLRVKILYNKKDTALVQVADVQQAQSAIQHLNNCPMFGQKLSVIMSRHQQVTMPREDTSANPTTKDFTNSPLHRFKVPGSKNFLNVCMPAKTLHISSIPTGVTEEQLRELFGQYGTVHQIRFFPNNPKMALIELGDVEEAVTALLYCHNHKIGEGARDYLRVSFSKTSISEQ
eukprot:Colp12_sorted_trinity150504_noHs@746